MIKKLAVLVVERADGSVEFSRGEKGEIYQKGRELKRTLNGDDSHNVFRLTAFGKDGVIVEYKWKRNAPAGDVTEIIDASEVPESEEEDSSDDVSADADKIRAALKEKGVRVPPRIGIDKLLELAIANGVEV